MVRCGSLICSDMLNEALECWEEWVFLQDLKIKHGLLDIIQCIKSACQLEHAYRLVKNVGGRPFAILYFAIRILHLSHHVLQ